MKKIVLPLSLFAAFAMSSCGGGETPKSETKKEITSCFYTYDETAGAEVRWKAFKTTDKVGVPAKFDEVNVSAGPKSTKVTDILEKIKFNIPSASTNTANKDRDMKIVKHFFGTMENTDLIVGQVKSAEGDNKSGKCTFYLTLNNVEKEVILNYSVEDALLRLTGEIDVANFGANAAVDAINKACEVLHTGPDGVSKTWSTVELLIETTLKKECH
jgi:polyisoprenoid-binding protein YceI